MKDYFSIGEISHLTGLSTHALRYYDKIHLVTPTHFNRRTGYRYYSYLQLYTLDWVRHLQAFGFTLDEIREILADSSASTLIRHFSAKRAELDRELLRLTDLRDTISHYLDYYSEIDRFPLSQVPYLRQEDTRYILTEPYAPGEVIHGTAGYRLMVKKRQAGRDTLRYFKRTGYLLDPAALCREEIRPLEYYIFLEQPPQGDDPSVRELPGGEYLCYRCRLLSESPELGPLEQFLPSVADNVLVLANECDYSMDDSISTYEQLQFEVQIRLERENLSVRPKVSE